MKIFCSILLGLTAAASLTAADSFDDIKTNLADAVCVEFEFISILESSIFDDVDSSFGQAVFASDGRYRIAIDNDLYIFDLKKLYSYSADNNQVVIETPDEDNPVGEEIGYITRLDDYFTSSVVRADSEYHLVKKSDGYPGIPDSLTVSVDSAEARLVRIEYFDINDELSRIVIISQTTSPACADSAFEATFPDSVDSIEL